MSEDAKYRIRIAGDQAGWVDFGYRDGMYGYAFGAFRVDLAPWFVSVADALDWIRWAVRDEILPARKYEVLRGRSTVVAAQTFGRGQ